MCISVSLAQTRLSDSTGSFKQHKSMDRPIQQKPAGFLTYLTGLNETLVMQSERFLCRVVLKRNGQSINLAAL